MSRTPEYQTWIDATHGWGQRMQEWVQRMQKPLLRQEIKTLRADLDQAGQALLQVAAALEQQWPLTTDTLSTSVPMLTQALSLFWPIEGREPSADQISPGGWSDDHIERGGGEALDIAEPEGTRLCWPHDGQVVQNGWLGEAGYAITEQWWTEENGHCALRLCHLQERPHFAVGDLVQAGTFAGYSGATGLVTGPHVHVFLEIAGVRQRLEGIYEIA